MCKYNDNKKIKIFPEGGKKKKKIYLLTEILLEKKMVSYIWRRIRE